MESMLNKLRSSVSSAATSAVSNAVQIASQVSNYLPGNPVTREFEATAHVASAGPGLVWKVYKGYKKSTKQDAAIFLFEKRQLDRWDKLEREQMLNRLRKGVSQLTRLRHPQVLTVQHPLEESRDTLAFATEPVFASLANILGQHTNAPSPLPTQLQNYTLFDVEIKYGLMQVSEGLAFLHNSVKIVHCNLCPENIVLNQQGAWKLFGFDFCVANTAAPEEPPAWPFIEYEPDRAAATQPSLDYLAPEYCLTRSLDTAADLYPLGVLTYALHNSGKPVFSNNDDFSTYKRNCCELKNTHWLKLESVPAGVREEVRRLLHATPQQRPDALQFSKSPYFEDVGVKTLSYLDQTFQWDNMQKSQFYKSLPQIIPQLPHRVSLLRVVPTLVRETVNPTMVPFVLPVILQVAERASKEEFVAHVLPHLTPIMRMTEPIQVMLQLMQKMELLLEKTPAEAVRGEVLPLLYRGLECDTQQIQELCLTVVPACAPLVEPHAMKNALLPRVKKLCLSTALLSVRVNCLVCVGKLLDQLDRWLVMDDILPFLEQVPPHEAPVIMAIVGIFKVAVSHKKLGISKEVMATKSLPFLFPLSIENSLSPSQHSSVMALVKDMVERVEAEHRTKLEQLHSIKVEEKALTLAMPTMLPGGGGASCKAEATKNVSTNSWMEQQAPSALSSSLTLHNKQRLGQEQPSQPPLLPSPPSQPPLLPSPPSSSSAFTPSPLPPPPVAATSTLMSPQQSSSALFGRQQQGGGSQMGGGMLGQGGMVGGSSVTTNTSGLHMMNGAMTVPARITTMPQASTAAPWCAATTPTATWSPATSTHSRPQQPANMNLTSLDSLLPSQPRPPPMNQLGSRMAPTPGMTMMAPGMMTPGTTMMTPLQPLLSGPPGRQTNNTGVKPLSSSDISDLLS